MAAMPLPPGMVEDPALPHTAAHATAALDTAPAVAAPPAAAAAAATDEVKAAVSPPQPHRGGKGITRPPPPPPGHAVADAEESEGDQTHDDDDDKDEKDEGGDDGDDDDDENAPIDVVDVEVANEQQHILDNYTSSRCKEPAKKTKKKSKARSSKAKTPRSQKPTAPRKRANHSKAGAAARPKTGHKRPRTEPAPAAEAAAPPAPPAPAPPPPQQQQQQQDAKACGYGRVINPVDADLAAVYAEATRVFPDAAAVATTPLTDISTPLLRVILGEISPLPAQVIAAYDDLATTLREAPNGVIHLTHLMILLSTLNDGSDGDGKGVPLFPFRLCPPTGIDLRRYDLGTALCDGLDELVAMVKSGTVSIVDVTRDIAAALGGAESLAQAQQSACVAHLNTLGAVFRQKACAEKERNAIRAAELQAQMARLTAVEKDAEAHAERYMRCAAIIRRRMEADDDDE